METPKLGILAGLQSLFGWYHSTPTNLTKDEAKRRSGTGGQIAGANDDESSSSKFSANASPESRYGDMLAMSESDLVGPILDVYAEEACQPDINKNRTLWYECDDGEVEKDLNLMLDRINAEEHLPSIVVGAAGTGNEFRRVLYNENGVQQLVGVPRTDSGSSSRMPVRRLWDRTTRRLIGFLWANEKPRDEDVLYPDHKEIFAPWSFIHFRRIHRSDTEYGVAMLDKLYPIWRKLEQSIDQMVLYRRHTMPNRHAVVIDTQEMDLTDAMEQLHIFAHMLRQQHVMTSNGAMESRHNPPALESMLFIPKRGSEDQTEITTLQGDKDVPDVPDIEQLLKQFYGGARVPKSYMGQDDEGSSLAQASLVSQDIRFARVVRGIRRMIVAGFYRLAQIHLAITGKDPTRYNVKVRMSRISTIEEEVNVAILEKQANLARTIADLCQQLEIPNREVIDLVFREYLSVPRYFLDIAKLGTSVARALGQGQEGGGPGGGGGFGGGLDGLDGLGDEEGGDADLGMPDDEAGGDLAAPPDNGSKPKKEPLLAGSRKRPNNLFEGRRSTTPRQRSVLEAMVRSLKTKMSALQDDAKKRVVVKYTKILLNEVRSISELHTSRKSSLVEGYTGETLTTETVPVIKGKTMHQLLESYRGTGPVIDIPDSLLVEAEATAAESHPIVKMRKGFRDAS